MTWMKIVFTRKLVGAQLILYVNNTIIVGIKIYTNRSGKLNGFSKAALIVNIMKRFKM